MADAMPDKHLTGWRVLRAMTSPAGLGAGGQERSHPGHPLPLPLPHSRRVCRKKGRGLSASPLVGPTDISESTHTHSRHAPTTPIPEKGVHPISFLGIKYYIDLPCAFWEHRFRAETGVHAVYLLTIETRGKGGKTAFMRVSSNG